MRESPEERTRGIGAQSRTSSCPGLWGNGYWILSYTNIGAMPDQGYQFLDSDDDTNSESCGFFESTEFLIKGLFRKNSCIFKTAMSSCLITDD